MSYDRTNTKLSEAIEALATSAHPTLQQRLAIAYLFHLRSVEPDELPFEVESQFKRLRRNSRDLQRLLFHCKTLLSLPKNLSALLIESMLRITGSSSQINVYVAIAVVSEIPSQRPRFFDERVLYWQGTFRWKSAL